MLALRYYGVADSFTLLEQDDDGNCTSKIVLSRRQAEWLAGELSNRDEPRPNKRTCLGAESIL